MSFADVRLPRSSAEDEHPRSSTIQMTEITNSKQYYILIDESGTLPDPNDKFVVIAAVGLHRVNDGRNLISRISEKIINWPELKRKNLGK